MLKLSQGKNDREYQFSTTFDYKYETFALNELLYSTLLKLSLFHKYF